MGYNEIRTARLWKGAGAILDEGSEFAMSIVTLEQAKAHVDELLASLRPGEELLITDQGHSLRQVKLAERTSWPCQAGSYRKSEFWMAPYFDAPLEEFKEDME